MTPGDVRHTRLELKKALHQCLTQLQEIESRIVGLHGKLQDDAVNKPLLEAASALHAPRNSIRNVMQSIG